MMPLFLLPFIIGSALGIGGTLFVSDAAKSIVNVLIIGGVAFAAFKVLTK